MSDENPKPTIHTVAMEIRDAMDDILPEGVGVTINTSEEIERTGTINLTVSSWPSDMFMLNKDRVIAERRAVLDGRKADFSHLPFLSLEARHLAETLQALVDHRFPPNTDDATGDSTWPVIGEVVFAQHSLEKERLAIIHSLKSKG
jgi:hypothetical protein